MQSSSSAPVSLSSAASFAFSSSRSLALLLNEQRRVREEWEQEEIELASGSSTINPLLLPRKDSGFLSHQRGLALKNEITSEYHFALAPAPSAESQFYFYHPFDKVRARIVDVLAAWMFTNNSP